MRWPVNTRLDPAARGTAKPGKPHHGLAEQRRHRMVPVILHTANVATARAIRLPNGVLPGLRGDDLPLNAREQPLRFGQCQTQTGDVAEIIGPADSMTSVHGPSPSAPVFTNLKIQAMYSPQVRERTRKYPTGRHTPNRAAVPVLTTAGRLNVTSSVAFTSPVLVLVSSRTVHCITSATFAITQTNQAAKEGQAGRPMFLTLLPHEAGKPPPYSRYVTPSSLTPSHYGRTEWPWARPTKSRPERSYHCHHPTHQSIRLLGEPLYILHHPPATQLLKEGAMLEQQYIPDPLSRLPDDASTMAILHALVRNPLEAIPEGAYRAGCVAVRLFGRDLVYVAHPDLVRRVLTDHDTFGQSDVIRRSLAPLLGDGVLTADGAHWRHQRRAAAPAFRNEEVLRLLPLMTAAAEAACDRWLAQPGQTVNVMTEMSRTTLDVILGALLPGSATIDPRRFGDALSEYLERSSWHLALSLLRAPRWMPYPGRSTGERAARKLRGLVLDILRRDAGRGNGGDADAGLLGVLRSHVDPESGRAFTETELLDNLLTFVAAGHETTATTLAWALFLLAKHPAVEAQILVELDAVAPTGGLDADRLAALTTTRRVVQETMRLYPAAPLLCAPRAGRPPWATFRCVLARRFICHFMRCTGTKQPGYGRNCSTPTGSCQNRRRRGTASPICRSAPDRARAWGQPWR